ncbi:MAG: DUF1559 domain-containing protein [Gemmataceae bacterium]
MKALRWLSPLIALTVLGFFLGIEGVLAVCFGWIPFLIRVIPQWTTDGPTLVVGVVAFVLFAGLVHRLGRASPRWTVRMTVGIVAGLFILFAAGIAVVGMAHQIAWMASSPEPMKSETLKNNVNHSESNLLSIKMGVMSYHDTMGHFPAGGTFTPDGRMLQSWETQLLPFIGYQISQIDMTLSWNHPRNQQYFKGPLRTFINPGFRSPQLEDSEGYGLSHYAANFRVMGANTKMTSKQITDGTSNTILIGEVNSEFQPWGHPVNWRDPGVGLNRAGQSFGGPPRTNRTLFMMADGTIRSFSNRIDPSILRALSTPNGGETLPGEDELNRD